MISLSPSIAMPDNEQYTAQKKHCYARQRAVYCPDALRLFFCTFIISFNKSFFNTFFDFILKLSEFVFYFVKKQLTLS